MIGDTQQKTKRKRNGRHFICKT